MGKLNQTQRQQLARHAGVARHAYNWGNDLCLAILDHNKNCSDSEKIKFPTAIDLHKWLNKLVKPQNEWYYDVSKCAPQFALRHLAFAWRDCFNKKKKRPQFKKKGRHDSFTLDGTIRILSSHLIQVPVIGKLKTYERLPTIHQPKNVTISREAERWFISFGIKTLATLSTGKVFEGAYSYRKLSGKLAKLQR